MTESRQVQSCTKMRNKALRRCALVNTDIRRKTHGDGKAVGFWRKMSGQFQSELPILFMTIECSQSVHSIVMGFILLRVLEFFVFRKMEMPETKNHLLCGWRQSVVQKNHLSVTIELFRHYCKKGKVILWRIRIMI